MILPRYTVNRKNNLFGFRGQTASQKMTGVCVCVCVKGAGWGWGVSVVFSCTASNIAADTAALILFTADQLM